MGVEGYTYLQLQNEVLDFQFSPTKYRPLVKVWLNSAQQTAVIQSEFRSQETTDSFSTEANVASYALPSDFSRFIDFYNTETHESLSSLGVKDYDELSTSTGRPYSYVALGSNLSLYPTPDGIYPLAMRYWKLPADMVADSDEPEIPAQYHDLLIAYAMNKAYLRENDYNAAKVWEEQWNGGLLKMRGEVQHDAFDGPQQVVGSWGNENAPPYNTWR
jgi:hypothetical protein